MRVPVRPGNDAGPLPGFRPPRNSGCLRGPLSWPPPSFPEEAGLGRGDRNATPRRVAALPGPADSPTRGRGVAFAGKCSVVERPAPPFRPPGSAGQPGFRSRTENSRRSSPSPDRGLDDPTWKGDPRRNHQTWSISGPKTAAGGHARPESRSFLKPGRTEVLPRPLQSAGSMNPKAQEPFELHLR